MHLCVSGDKGLTVQCQTAWTDSGMSDWQVAPRRKRWYNLLRTTCQCILWRTAILLPPFTLFLSISGHQNVLWERKGGVSCSSTESCRFRPGMSTYRHRISTSGCVLWWNDWAYKQTNKSVFCPITTSSYSNDQKWNPRCLGHFPLHQFNWHHANAQILCCASLASLQ